MKKIFVISILSFSSFATYAGDWYGSIGLDQKDKQNSSTGEYHNVFSMTIGKKLGDGYSAEVLIEDEQVRSGAAKHEGLYQLGAKKDFHTETMFTPYVGLAIGTKSKTESGLSNSLDFPFYRYDLGVKAKLNDQFSVRLGWRHRQAFDDKFDGKDTKWNTNETTLALSYKLTDVDTITAAYKIERRVDSASSEYNTVGLSYARAF